jgi:membrane-associated phospholipid phosphatase
MVCLTPIHAYTFTETDSAQTVSAETYIACTAGAAAITLTLFHYDQQIYNGLYEWKERNPAVKAISPVITNGGDGKFSMGLFAGFAGYSLIAHDKKSLEVAKIGFESFLFTGIVVQVLKYTFGRERPSHATQSGGSWHGPLSYLKHRTMSIASFDSFPSGHTATVFAAATTLSDMYTDPWVSYTAYSLASLVAISRITESTHWASDCFVGALIGHFGTKIVEHFNYGSNGYCLVPAIDNHSYGVHLTINIP